MNGYICDKPYLNSLINVHTHTYMHAHTHTSSADKSNFKKPGIHHVATEQFALNLQWLV